MCVSLGVGMWGKGGGGIGKYRGEVGWTYECKYGCGMDSRGRVGWVWA